MKSLVDGFEAVRFDFGVNLGGGDVGMAEHHLDRTQVGTARQQMGGKGMAQHVGTDPVPGSSLDGDAGDDLPEPVAGHGAAPVVQEQKGAGFFLDQLRPSLVKVVFDTFPGRLAKGHQPFFVALAQHPQMTAGHVAGLHRQADQFRDPQAGGIQEMQHGIVAQNKRCFFFRQRQELFDLGDAQGLGQAVAGFGRVDIKHRVAGEPFFPAEESKKTAKRRQPPGIAAGADFVLMAVTEKGPDMFGGDCRRLFKPVSVKKVQEKTQV